MAKCLLFLLVAVLISVQIEASFISRPIPNTLSLLPRSQSNLLFWSRGGSTENSLRKGDSPKVIIVHNTQKFDDEIKKATEQKKLVVIDFSAKWCGPCKMISPIYDEIASSPQHNQAVFLKVDVDELKEITQRYQIRSMPTFLFLKENQLIDRFSGANIELLKNTIRKHL